MRHHQSSKKLGLTKKKRRALLCSLTEALVENGQIQTTEARAKALRPFIEPLITKGKEDTQHARRLLKKKLAGRRELAEQIIEDIAPRFKDRPGGYTRIIKLPPRQSDASPQAIIQFVDQSE